MQIPLIRLQCGCNSYEWGKKGDSSAAAKFAAATPTPDFSIQNDKPYAELWMGTHPSLPSKDMITGRSLLDMVQDNQALMSTAISQKYEGRLPFLFKVLSIAKALSIQAHPNKKLAEQLHKENPKEYKDDNHKPEMTIAVTPFEGLCGFRPLHEIAHNLRTVKSLRALVGEEMASKFENAVGNGKQEVSAESGKAVLKEAFSALMNNKQEVVDKASEDLVKAAKAEGNNFAGGGIEGATGEQLSELVERLNGQFPGDIGLFVMFFLNYVQLAPGEAMFLRADDIHAYISGDIIECMASSDNVVRAGFTPKFKDVPNLISMLTYNYAPIDSQKMSPVDYPYATLNTAAYSGNSTSLLYDPPIEEFAVVRTALKRKAGKSNGVEEQGGSQSSVLGSVNPKITFAPLDGPSIIICTEGEGKIAVGPSDEDMKAGYVYFVGATAELVLESTSATEEFVTFRAFCELDGHKK